MKSTVPLKRREAVGLLPETATFFSAAFPFCGHYRYKRQPLHDHVPHCREINQIQCSRLYDTATCYLHTAILLGRCRSILSQVERSSEPDIVCYRISPFGPTTCCPAGPESLTWPEIQPGRHGQAEHVPLYEEASGVRPGCALCGPSHQRGRRDAPQPHKVLRGQLTRDTCIHIPPGSLRCVSWSTRGLHGSTASSQTSGDQKQKNLRRLAKMTSFAFRKRMGKTNSHKFFEYYTLSFECLVGTFVTGNVNAGRWAIFVRENLLPDLAIVTQETTCQGRDNVVARRSGDRWMKPDYCHPHTGKNC